MNDFKKLFLDDENVLRNNKIGIYCLSSKIGHSKSYKT